MASISNSSENDEFEGKKRLIRLVMLIVVLIVATLAILTYGLSLFEKGNDLAGIIVVVVGIGVVTIGGISVRMYNQRTLVGLAIADEMSTFQLYKAGYFSFVGSFYTLILVIILLENVSTSRNIVYIAMGLNLMIFIILHTIIRREDLS